MKDFNLDFNIKISDLLDLIPDPIFIINTEGVVMVWNKAMEDLTNIKKQDILGKGDYIYSIPFFGESKPILIDSILKSALEKGSPSDNYYSSGEVYFPHLMNGVHLSAQAYLLYNSNKEIIGALEILKDITEQVQTELYIAENAEKYSTLFHNFLEAIVIHDGDKIIEVNQQALDLFEYSASEINKKNLSDLIFTKNKELYDEYLENVYHKEKFKFETLFVTKNGKTFDGELSSTLFHYIDKNLIQTIIRNITERKNLEEERLKSQKMESVGILAGGIAHDFNNFLSAIIGNISLAKIDLAEKDKDLIEILNDAEKASNRAKNLTKQLLTFSKGGAPITQVTNLDDIVREVIAFALRGSNVTSETNIQNTNLWNVIIDSNQITQVINNLIINSIQAMPTGGTIFVELKNYLYDNSRFELIRTKEKYIELKIRDEGVGIPKKYHSRIFDPYFTTKPSGSGLGLSVCYSIIKNHEGYILFDSEYGKGTTFYVYLPATEKEIKKKSSKKALKTGKGRILVMDDQEYIRNIFKKMIKRLGYKGDAVENAESLINMYLESLKHENEKIDLVIMDLTIPGNIGGEEAIKELIKIDPNVNAIVSSGYANSKVMSNYKEYGFKGILPKPFTIEELSSKISDVLEKEN